ncbi:MAG TPA: proline iminopeptidase-family hydrolase [Candidatus Acidoferrum sp.]|nr:proline iminopeptidase-family hydrolase [Candidatus Acidoferrum sp.]
MKEVRAILVTLAVAVSLLVVSTYAGTKPSEGLIPVKGGKVWYRIVGSGKGTPLLVLHGGPGVPSYYLKPLAALGDDRPVIFYDQLGAGHSDTTSDTTLFTMPRFLDELATVRKTLDLKEVHLYGHSWGSMMVVDYLLTKPSGVKSCILAGAAMSIPRWQHDADSLVKTLPDSVQQVIQKNEAAGTTQSPEYQQAVMTFYQMYLARRLPWSADLDSSLSQINGALYAYMNGPSEFAITGTFRDYDRTTQLRQIAIPTLFICGQYDEAVPSTEKYFQSLVPKAELVVVPNSAHLAMQDNPEFYVNALRSFLRRADKK